jgi:hypothetical protein
MVPIGLAMPRPAISGAEPWIGSYNPGHRLPFSGALANEADGRRPKDPGMTLLSSDKLIEIEIQRVHYSDQPQKTYMSPNMFSVKITPFNFRGLEIISIAAESTR